MKKKTIILTVVIVAAIVCTITVLLVIHSKRAHNVPGGSLPIISDEGIRDDILVDSDTIDTQDDPSGNESFIDGEQNHSFDNNDTPIVEGEDQTLEEPLVNYDTPIIIG